MSEAVLRNSGHPEPGRVPAGVLAVLVHVIFFAFMIFGMSWKTSPPEGMVVDLWSSLPQPVVKEAPALVQPIRPVPPPEPKPVSKVETPPPAKPDIALKEKIEKPKPVEKEKEKEKPKPVEKKPPPKDLKELIDEAEKKELKEQKARVTAEIAQLQRQQEADDRLRAQAAAAQSRQANEVAEYKARILAKIKRNIVMPPDLPGNPVAEFDVTLLPGGDILDVKLSRSSGFATFDSAVERAIYLSKPLPLPPDPAMFVQFRNLNVKVHYRE